MKRYLISLILLCSPLLHAEEVKLLACQNSLETVDYGLAFIEKAEQSIEFAPCFFGGEVCQKYLQAIEKRIKLNTRLQAYILCTTTLLEENDKAYLAQLQKSYPRQFHLAYSSTVVDLSKDLSAIDNHVKMLVVDERYFSLGGTNYDDSMCSDGTTPVNRPHGDGIIAANLPSGSRDQDLIGKSQEVARELRLVFHKLFALWTEYNKVMRFTSKDPDDYVNKWLFKEIDRFRRPYVERFENDPRVLTVDSSAIQVQLGGPKPSPNLITKAYIKLLDEAKQEVTIGNLYFSPIDPLMDAFKRAAKRGIKIKVITNGVNDKAPAYNEMFAWANRISYLPVVYGRDFHLWEKHKCKKCTPLDVEFYEYYVKDILYHKKVMVVDERFVVIGSYNLGHRSDMSDYELAVIVDSKELAAQALEPLKVDFTNSLKVSIEKMQEWYFDPIISYKSEVQKKFHPLL